jgi:hypothetical protein
MPEVSEGKASTEFALSARRSHDQYFYLCANAVEFGMPVIVVVVGAAVFRYVFSKTPQFSIEGHFVEMSYQLIYWIIGMGVLLFAHQGHHDQDGCSIVLFIATIIMGAVVLAVFCKNVAGYLALLNNPTGLAEVHRRRGVNKW